MRLLYLFSLPAIGQAHFATNHAEELIGCTAIAIDGAATVDGSAYAGMNADSGNGDNRLTYVPPRTYEEGSFRPVYTFNLSYPRFVGYGRSDLFHPFEGHRALFVPVGHIPEAKATYGYYESTEPLINEMGLGFGESSCAAMLVNKFAGDSSDRRDVPVGMLDTVTMMQLALERCATARCAVETMGALAEEFGFVPTPGEPTVGYVKGRVAYDDAGEAYTIADATGEAWVFHVLGGVTGITNSVWAARRVPKGHFAVVANNFILGEIPMEQSEDFIFNKDIFRAARAAGLWDGQGSLDFQKAFAPDDMTFESPKGKTPIPLYATVRMWNLNRLVAPSSTGPFKPRSGDYDFSVKVEKSLTHRDVMNLFRTHYEGTEFDLTQGMLAGPFGNPFTLEGGPKFGQIARGVSIARTLYSIIVQTGPQKQMGWYAQDVPATSVYVPLFCKAAAVSTTYSTGHNQNFTRESASWAFNFVNNYMQLNYQAMSEQEVFPAIKMWQDKMDQQVEELAGVDVERLRDVQISLQESVVKQWWQLADFIVMKYNDGKINWPKAGVTYGYPEKWSKMVGFSNDVRPLWVKPAAVPPVDFDGFVAKTVPLPLLWHEKTAAWTYGGVASLRTAAQQNIQVPLWFQVAVAAVAVCTGVWIGRLYERRKVAPTDTYQSLS